ESAVSALSLKWSEVDFGVPGIKIRDYVCKSRSSFRSCHAPISSSSVLATSGSCEVLPVRRQARKHDRYRGHHNENMRRVAILGRGASSKSTLARRLGEITGLPVIELDQIFWRPGLVATPHDEWAALQKKLAKEDGWIMD